ncbi:hypothetical protein Tco_0086067 [Tanacetum coccineum]
MDIQMSRLEKMIGEKTVTTPATVKAVEEVVLHVVQTIISNNLSVNKNEIFPNEAKTITTRSGASYDGPSIPPPVVEKEPEGDILLLESLLNSDPSPSLNQGNYLPEIRKSLKFVNPSNLQSMNTSEVELKDLPPHLKYAFLADNNKLPVIIAKDLIDDEKTALIKVLKFRKQAIAWKLSDIKGINPEFCSHKNSNGRHNETSVTSGPTSEKG